MDYIFNTEIPKQIKALEAARGNVKQYTKELVVLHSSLDEAHPFRDGNERSTRTFIGQLSKSHGYRLDFTNVDRGKWIESCIASIKDNDHRLKTRLFSKVVSLSPARFTKTAANPITFKNAGSPNAAPSAIRQ